MIGSQRLTASVEAVLAAGLADRRVEDAALAELLRTPQVAACVCPQRPQVADKSQRSWCRVSCSLEAMIMLRRDMTTYPDSGLDLKTSRKPEPDMA